MYKYGLRNSKSLDQQQLMIDDFNDFANWLEFHRKPFYLWAALKILIEVKISLAS